MTEKKCIKEIEDMDIQDRMVYTMTVLLATVVNLRKGISWKSKYNTKGEPIEFIPGSGILMGNYFYVGVNTINGPVISPIANEYWDMFECKELDRAEDELWPETANVNNLLSLL